MSSRQVGVDGLPIADLLCWTLSFEASSSEQWNKQPMPNSTDGNKVSILAGETQQASEDRTAERIASAVSKTKKEFHDKFFAANSAAKAVRRAERRLKINIWHTLEAVHKLSCEFRPDPAGRPKPVPSTAGVGVRSAGNSDHDTAELVRFTLGETLKPASLNACVELLRRAEQENIAPRNFRRFMRKVGGIDVNAKVVNESAKQPGAGTALLKHPAKGR